MHHALRTFLALVLSWTLIAVSACADDNPSAHVLRKADGSIWSGTEYCGNGIDDDLDGQDALCPGNDKDRDGYAAAQDCDDGNREVFPGESLSCSADCGVGIRTCQANGAFTPCSCQPLCEASGSGRCFYISALSGNDANAGTFQSPWRTFANISSFTGTAPGGWRQLAPGDFVYVQGGDYRDTRSVGGKTSVLALVNVSGTSGAPITIKQYGDSVASIDGRKNALGIFCQNCKHVTFSGLEVNNALDQGILISDSESVRVKKYRVFGTTGTPGGNISGLYIVRSRDITAERGLLADNFLHGGTTDGNSRDIVVFDSLGRIEIAYSSLVNTAAIQSPGAAGCITYKHGSTDPTSTFLLHHNFFRNCAFQGVGSGTNSSNFHHNLLVDSEPFMIANFGGTTNNSNNVIEYNTVINGGGLSYNPDNTYFPIGSLTFRKNIVVDNRVNNAESAVVRIHPYGSDALYLLLMAAGRLSFSNNCYFNKQGAITFSLFSSVEFGPLGGLHTFATWRALGLDSGSSNADPQLGDGTVPSNPACSDKGITFGW